MQGHYPPFPGGYGYPMYPGYPTPMMFPVNYPDLRSNFQSASRNMTNSISRVSSIHSSKSTISEAKPTSQTSPPSLERNVASVAGSKANQKSLSQQQGKLSDNQQTKKESITSSATPSNLSARSTPNANAAPTTKAQKPNVQDASISMRKGNQGQSSCPDMSGLGAHNSAGKQTWEDSSPPSHQGTTNADSSAQASHEGANNSDRSDIESKVKMVDGSSKQVESELTPRTGTSRHKPGDTSREQACGALNKSMAQTRSKQASEPETGIKNKSQTKCNPQEEAAGQPSRAVAQSSQDVDQEGHFHVEVGKLIDQGPEFPQGRYRVIQLLGSGTYGKVLLCADQKYNNASVAVKVIRKHDRTTGSELYRAAAKNEIEILRDLGGKHGTVLLLRDFQHHMHICMTFELLGDNLQDALKNQAVQFGMHQIRNISHQILNAITYVHSKKIIHTDLKPENILLLPSQSKDQALLVKIVDFGTAIYSDAWHPPIVGTMHYRAPEAVLQAGYGFSLDIWAIGCIIVELCTGHKLFELVHPDVHLELMQRCIGPIPSDLIYRAWSNPQQQNRNLFQVNGGESVQLAPARKDAYSVKAIQAAKPLKHMIKHPDLVDLVLRMLAHEPAKRLSGAECLRHVFYEVSDEAGDESLELLDSLDDASTCWAARPSVVSWFIPRLPPRLACII